MIIIRGLKIILDDIKEDFSLRDSYPLLGDYKFAILLNKFTLHDCFSPHNLLGSLLESGK